MKKILSLMTVAVAMVALSGCKGLTPGGDTFTSIAITNLGDGYLISGEDGSYKTIELSYCGGRYELYHDGATHKGTFSIKSSTETINMFEKTPDDDASYRIDTENGYLEAGETYTIKFNGYDITVETIRQDSTCY
jgi:hypothetical protein